MKETSSSASDPRQPSMAKPYVPPTLSPQDLPIDYAGFFAVIFGVVGVMFRVRLYLRDALEILAKVPLDAEYKLCSWLAIIFCAQSLANMKNLENDLKQISMAMMFAIMGLVNSYFGPSRSASKQ